MQGMDRTVRADAALAEVTERLAKRFDQVPREAVEATVIGCASRWRDARITDFVPVLTEHRCRARLRAMSDADRFR
jgi:hypothetical protein